MPEQAQPLSQLDRRKAITAYLNAYRAAGRGHYALGAIRYFNSSGYDIQIDDLQNLQMTNKTVVGNNCRAGDPLVQVRM